VAADCWDENLILTVDPNLTVTKELERFSLAILYDVFHCQFSLVAWSDPA
jgi:hypothetical protein